MEYQDVEFYQLSSKWMNENRNFKNTNLIIVTVLYRPIGWIAFNAVSNKFTASVVQLWITKPDVWNIQTNFST